LEQLQVQVQARQNQTNLQLWVMLERLQERVRVWDGYRRPTSPPVGVLEALVDE
jgi:hypothetical protein